MENHGDIRRDRKTSRWDAFASRWKGNGNSCILWEPSSTVGDISRKIAVLPYTGWDLKNFKDIPKTNWRWGFFNQKRSRTKKKSGSIRSKWFESMWVCKWNFRNSEATETALQCNQVSAPVLFAISHCDHLQNKPVGGEDAKCVHPRWGWFLGLDASGDIHLGLLVFVLPTLWHWEDDTHWYLRLLTSVPLQNWSESTPTASYLHVLHLLCRADVSPNDVAASEDTLVGRCILPASWDAHREVV